jgi:coproporphyrinogen III oxidase
MVKRKALALFLFPIPSLKQKCKQYYWLLDEEEHQETRGIHFNHCNQEDPKTVITKPEN